MVSHGNGNGEAAQHGLRDRLHEIIFEADTPAGKAFDVVLLVSILASVAAVMLESVAWIEADYGDLLRTLEWGFTILFTIEYLLRLYSVGRPWRYATSFFGIVDLLAILPTYLSIFISGSQSLLVIRILRMLRIFRVFKMARYLGEANVLMRALHSSSRKVAVFLGTVLMLAVIVGALMYLVEHGEHGFESIPASIYWAIVTMTTVGYGDIVPGTTLGQVFASSLMITGYSIIAVPSGIVTVELQSATRMHISTQACKQCSKDGHDMDALHCKYCGADLGEQPHHVEESH